MNLNEEEIMKSLNSCLTSIPPTNKSSKDFISLLQSNSLFKIFTQDISQPLVLFRLLGVIEFGITVEQAENEYGINLNQMNLDLARAVNMGKTHHLAIPIQLEDSVICIGVAIGDEFQTIVPALIESAERLKNNYFMGVKTCKCGW